MSIITHDISSNVLDGILNMHATRRNLDSSTDERRCFTVTTDDIDLYNSLFKYNTGTVSDGKTVSLNEVTVYVRIPVNIHMLEQNIEAEYESYVYTAEARANNGYASLQVFIDGYKIPDSEVKFYPTKSNVDIFIPNKYLPNTSDHEMVVEKKRYDLFPYVHYYAESTSEQSISISLSTAVKNRISEISGNLEKNLQIYVNKTLYNSSRTISFSNNNLKINITSDISDSEIEIEFDPYVVLYFPAVAMTYDDEKNVWEIPETYIDSIHGPLSNFSCYFFINSLRVMNDVVDQKGRLHFEYDSTDGTTNNTVSFYLSDRNLITDTDLILYNRDYYLYNFVGTEAVTSALHTTLTGNSFLDEGAYKKIDFTVTKKLGNTKIVLTLPEGVVFDPSDTRETIKISVYKTTQVSNTQYTTDTELTELDSNDYTVDTSSDPVTITITAPSNYMADGIQTNGVIEISSYFTWDYVLNDDGDYFTRSSVEEILENYNSTYDDSSRVATMLVNRPYLMRTFLENFGHDVENYTVEYNGVDAYVYLGLPESYNADDDPKLYDISVNNQHIANANIVKLNKDVTDVFKIEGKYFSKGSNDVSIEVIDKVALEYQEFEPDDIGEEDGLRTLTVSGFDHLGDYTQNIILLVKVDSNTDGIATFPTSANIGYQLFTDYEFGPYDSDTDTISIIFTKIPENTFLVYNKNFSTSYAYVKPDVSSVTDVIIPIYYGNSANPIPFIPRGKINVYCGDDKYIEGVDYYVKTPEDADDIVGTYIIMKRIVLPGSQVDIYMTNYKTTSLFSKTGYMYNNYYGLFYLGNLNYPFSTKYINLYVNGYKLGEDDIDILSDKLIRVHSMPVPMYDLVLESSFTVDDSELATYINQYIPDDFEVYLARLFVGADYSGSESGSQYDINEVYESFIESVDSVNREKNPTAREAIWIPCYNEDEDIIGVSNDGDAMNGNDIYASLIVGDVYIVAGENGKVASCHVDNVSCEWTNCDADAKAFDGAVYSDGDECNGEDITCMALLHDYIIFGTSSGNLYAYGVNSETWFTKDELSFLDISTTWPSGTSINGFVYDSESDILYMYGDNGTVDGLTWDTLSWFGTDFNEYTKAYTASVGVTGLMGNIKSAFLTSDSFYGILVVLGEDGKVCSCYTECDQLNGWRRYDSSLYLRSAGMSPEIYSDGTIRDSSTIYNALKFFNHEICIGDDAIVTYNNGSNFVNSDALGICSDGSPLNNLIAYDGISYNEKYMLIGGENGKITQYEGETQTWYNCDSGLGITSDGTYMSGRDIYTAQLTVGDTHYAIFAGEDGKVCSYNISVSEVPYRYDPFKSSFLEWYTTPGNAVIATTWDIPDEIAAKFNMLLESNTDDESGSVIVRAGDSDLMVDINMNDDGDYLWTLAERNRFLAQFIKELPDGYYTADQIYELFMASNAKYMLYEDDLPVLRGGNEIDLDDDINITE